MPIDVGDFRLVDRRALEAFKAMPESNRYVRGMFSWIGFRQVGVPFQRAERFAGETKYPLTKMLKFATDGVVSFSSEPLRLALKLGFVVSGLSFLFGFLALVFKLAGLYSIPGLASIAVFISFLGGIQLLVLGLMGEYIARIHDEVKRRPLYLVSDAHGRRLHAWLELHSNQIVIRVDDRGAAYPVRIDPMIQSAELTESDGGLGSKT